VLTAEEVVSVPLLTVPDALAAMLFHLLEPEFQ
jgi:hypothetical protein